MNDLGIVDKVKTSLAQSPFEALVAAGVDNAQYLSGGHLPFLYYRPDQHVIVVFPKSGEPVAVCPELYASSLLRLGWIQRVVTYSGEGSEVLIEAVAGVVAAAVRSGATVGIDAARVSAALFADLTAKLKSHRLVPCDDLLRNLRIVKTDAEQALISQVAYRTDHGINAMLHHVIVTKPKTQISIAEEIRVHCMERNLDEVGYHSHAQAAAGRAAERFYPLCPTSGFNYGFSATPFPQAGEVVRVRMRASQQGYWNDAARVLINGHPTPGQSTDYAELVALREAALAVLRPGVRASSACDSITATARKASIDLVDGLSLGHGVGVTPYEPPFLNSADETILQAGMTLVLTPAVRWRDGTIIQSNDTVTITETGCRIVGWWKDWREPYIPILAI